MFYLNDRVIYGDEVGIVASSIHYSHRESVYTLVMDEVLVHDIRESELESYENEWG